jgi:hypothetical protein
VQRPGGRLGAARGRATELRPRRRAGPAAADPDALAPPPRKRGP